MWEASYLDEEAGCYPLYFSLVLQGQRGKGKENAVQGTKAEQKVHVSVPLTALKENDSDKKKKKDIAVQKGAMVLNPGAWRKGKGKKHAMRVANYLSMMKEQYAEVG